MGFRTAWEGPLNEWAAQTGGKYALTELKPGDRSEASALFEGDAMAVMTAYGARHAHKPVKAAIAAGAAMLRAVDAETLLRISGKSPELLKAPAILREELVLPYAAGFALVAEVYRRGGFPLVDRMFANPPASSHQILHPEAYFSGEGPVSLTAVSGRAARCQVRRRESRRRYSRVRCASRRSTSGRTRSTC